MPLRTALTLAAACLAATACRPVEQDISPPADMTPSVGADEQDEDHSASATLRDRDGNVAAEANLYRDHDGNVMIALKVLDLPPGMHGFHIHETGDCSAPDFSSAGGHFNPGGLAEHGVDENGMEAVDGPHRGDLPNIKVDADGTTAYKIKAEGVNLDDEGIYSLLDGSGTALVIHADADDYVTDPAGNSGPRIACGVIKES
ncbi:MAG: superoxide dismutase family protein [Nannocystaceae bacterium]